MICSKCTLAVSTVQHEIVISFSSGDHYYVALKFYAMVLTDAHQKFEVFKHILSVYSESTHPSKNGVRLLSLLFGVEESKGEHLCCSHALLLVSIEDLRTDILTDDRLPLDLAVQAAKQLELLSTLDYLR